MTHHTIHRRRLAALSILAAIAGGANPAFAAPWYMRANLTEAQYENVLYSELPDGFRPISVSANGTGENTRYTVIAIEDPDVLWTRRTNRTRDELQDDFTYLAGAYGFRPVAIDASGEYPNERYVAVFVIDDLPASDWAVRHGQTEAAWDSDWALFNAAGFRLTWASCIGSGSNQRFNGIWRRNTEGWSWLFIHGLDFDEFEDYMRDKWKVGFRVTGMTAYGDPNDLRYGGLFLRPDGANWEIQPRWETWHEQDVDQFDAMADNLGGTLLQPACAIQYGSDAEPRFGSTWFEDAGPLSWNITGTFVPSMSIFDMVMEQFMISRKIPRGTLAITKDERLVFARAYTNAPASVPLTTVDDQGRTASVTKTITAVAILRLIEDGVIGDPSQTLAENLDTKLVDLPGFDADEWTDPQISQVTIRHLLQHRGGWDSSVSFDPMFRDEEISEELGDPLPIGQYAIKEYMKSRNLDFTPGTQYAYSNFGYMLLGHVIEHLTSTTYETWVRDNVLCHVGAETMVTGSSWGQHPNEMDYRDPMNRHNRSVNGSDEIVPWPYGDFHLANMEAHGGWVATATELARFVSDFTVDTNSVLLDSSSIDFMWAPTTQSAGKYGAGWSVSGTTRYHNGYLPGTNANMIRLEYGVTISVIFNQRVKVGEANTPVSGLDWHIRRDLIDAADSMPSWPGHDFFAWSPGCVSLSPCPADLDEDGVVGITDLLGVLAQWGTSPGGPPDFDGDGDVGIGDLLELLANWGACP